MKEYDLILPIKKKWFGMILSGEKKEEYREVKPYYTTRIQNILEKPLVMTKLPILATVKFVNGYGNTRPCFIADCEITRRIGGKKEWGANPFQDYYVFKIIEVGK